MSRKPLDIYVSDRGRRGNATIASIAMTWSTCVIQYPFSLFNYDSFRVVPGYRPNMGYLRLTAGLMFCSCGFPLTLPYPYPV